MQNVEYNATMMGSYGRDKILKPDDICTRTEATSCYFSQTELLVEWVRSPKKSQTDHVFFITFAWAKSRKCHCGHLWPLVQADFFDARRSRGESPRRGVALPMGKPTSFHRDVVTAGGLAGKALEKSLFFWESKQFGMS